MMMMMMLMRGAVFFFEEKEKKEKLYKNNIPYHIIYISTIEISHAKKKKSDYFNQKPYVLITPGHCANT